MDDYEMIKEKLAFLTDKGLIHFSAGKNRFYNGSIKEFLGDSMIFIDRKLGEIKIFYQEILPQSISTFKEAE